VVHSETTKRNRIKTKKNRIKSRLVKRSFLPSQ